MRVTFQSNDPQGKQLRDLALARSQFVMRRLQWLVSKAVVKLNDVNGPQGGVDKQCRMELRTNGSGTVVITSMASDWRVALDQALQRAQHALVRKWQRESQGRSLRNALTAH